MMRLHFSQTKVTLSRLGMGTVSNLELRDGADQLCHPAQEEDPFVGV
jgi:hypothetical protein